MFAIHITETNLDIITALNGGVQPLFQINEHGGRELTYLVMESGEVNRIITHRELMELKKTRRVTSTSRKFYYVA
jgi:hypothetical protein